MRDVRRGVEVAVAHGIHEHLQRERRDRPRRARAARTPRRGCRPRCRPPTAMRDASPPNSAACVAAHSQRAPAVVERRRERVLGREPVVDRHDDRARRVRELAGDAVELLDAADHPAAAVEVHDDREARLGRRPVDAHGHAVGVAVLDREHRLGLAAAPSRRAGPSRRASSCDARRSGGISTRVAFIEVADRLRLRVQRHVRRVPNASRSARDRDVPRRPGRAAGTRACRRSRGTARRRARPRSARPRRAAARAYASPWSRSGSNSAVITTARREPGEVGRAQRRQAPVVEVGRRARVVVVEPAHARRLRGSSPWRCRSSTRCRTRSR